MNEHRETTFDEALLSGYLDGELTQADAQRVRLRLEEDPAAKSLVDELEQIREAARSTRLPAPADEEWNETPRSGVSRILRRTGWILVIVWVGWLGGLALWGVATGPRDWFEQSARGRLDRRPRSAAGFGSPRSSQGDEARPLPEGEEMIVTTTPTIEHKRIVRTLGLVRGNTIRARHIGRDIMAALRNVVGGEVSEYTKLFGEAREQSLDRMVEEAEEFGANAIVGVRFTTSQVMNAAAELLVYGTAVVIEDE